MLLMTWAAALLIQLPIVSGTAELVGAVTYQGPLPGASVTIEGLELRQVVVSNGRGEFRAADLPLGAYLVTIELPGFRARTRRITLTVPGTTRLDVELAPGPLEIVDYIGMPSESAFHEADAVAHLRIEDTAAPAQCDNDSIAALHLARVLSVAKGELPPSIWLKQIGAGECYEGARLLRAGGAPYRSGQEYIVFLRRAGDLFESLAGDVTTLRVEAGRLAGREYPPILKNMTVPEAFAALRRLAP